MRKLFKFALFGLLALSLFLAAALFWIDGIARIAVEKGSTAALGVPTTLDSMKIGLFSGEAGMQGLVVSNPEGFSGAHFLKLEGAELAVSLGSLLGERVVVPKIRLKGINLSIEQSASGTNLGKILENLQKNEPAPSESPGPSAPSSPSEKGKTFVIEEILIEETRVAGTITLLGGAPKTLSYTIPEIRLRQVGSDSADGASLARVVSQIVRAILKGAIEEGKDLPKEILGELKSKAESIREQLQEQGKELKGKAEELKGLFRKKKD